MRLMLLLLGTEYLKARWVWFVVVGALWLAAGTGLILDGMDGGWDFPLELFGVLLLVEGLVSLIAAFVGIAVRPLFRYLRGCLILAIALLILLPFRMDEFLLSLLFGMAFIADGLFRIASAWVVRFPGWRTSIGGGLSELVIAILFILPWPVGYAGTVPYAIGVALLLSGWTVLQVGLRLRILPPHTSLGMLFARGRFLGSQELRDRAAERGRPSGEVLTVHVWTALGVIKNPLHRPLIDHYIAAVDKKGVISTGHSAMEILPDIYISHYPKNDLDHSPTEFVAMLRATAENDVRGRFLPSYAVESQEWCQSTERFHFRYFDGERVRRFWELYRRDDTYNLTNRNCSSVVAHALEIALEGTLGQRGRGYGHFFRVVFSTEFWAASFVASHAEKMAWTPGFMHDYAANLKALEHPAPLTLPAMVRGLLRNMHLGGLLWRTRRRGLAPAH